MQDSRAGVVFRVEVIRERSSGFDAVGIDITAYIDREPDDNEADFGRLSRVPSSLWNTRMLYTGDFAALAEAVAAVETLYPNIDRLNCYEWPAEAHSALVLAPLIRSGGTWGLELRGGRLDWRID